MNKKFLKNYQAEGIKIVLQEVYGIQEKKSQKFIDTVEQVFA